MMSFARMFIGKDVKRKLLRGKLKSFNNVVLYCFNVTRKVFNFEFFFELFSRILNEKNLTSDKESNPDILFFAFLNF